MFRSYYPFLALLQLEGFGAAECVNLWRFAGVPLDETFQRLKSPTGRKKISALLGKTVGEIPWDLFDRRLRDIGRAGVGVVCIADAEYPGYLRDIKRPPPIIFYKGNLSSLDRRGVAIVGTRQPSARGASLARRLARDLSRLGILVVSGLARGIDTAAHQGSLEGTGNTVGVMGTGLDVIYPLENRSLMEAITSRGCLLTEQLLGTQPAKFAFPQRNRLISAVSRMVVVVEAGQRSGALITARWAIEQGREVGAVPGVPGDFRSRGVNKLLKTGAVLVECADDILNAVPLLHEGLPGKVPNGLERGGGEDPICLETSMKDIRPESIKVLEALTSISTDPDGLAAHLDMDVSLVQGILLDLEMRGIVERDLTGCYFRR